MIWALISALLSMAALCYVFGGYCLALRVLGLFRRGQGSLAPGGTLPPVTIFIPALNEEEHIREKLEDIHGLDYPQALKQVLLVSDGSSDHTVQLAREFAAEHPELRLDIVEFEQNQGVYAVQNRAALEAAHDILLSTDTGTRLDQDFLRQVMPLFADPAVGVVGGRLRFRNAGQSTMARLQDRYRQVENLIRCLESDLGSLVKTDACCTAFRKELWEELEPFEDLDQIITLVARKKGFRAAHAPEALATDMGNATVKQELKARSRMTRKALLSISNRWKFRDVLRYPLFSFCLFSHKIMRFMTPLFFVVLAASLLWLWSLYLPLWQALLAIVLGLALVLVDARFPLPLLHRPLGLVRGLAVSNWAYVLGWFGWIRGDREGRWKVTRTIE